MQSSFFQHEWEKKIRAIKLSLWRHSHPAQEFGVILVAKDIAAEIKETIGADLNNSSLGYTFDELPIAIDPNIPSGSVVFVPYIPPSSKDVEEQNE